MYKQDGVRIQVKIDTVVMIILYDVFMIIINFVLTL
jgi:hypothetical protein